MSFECAHCLIYTLMVLLGELERLLSERDREVQVLRGDHPSSSQPESLLFSGTDGGDLRRHSKLNASIERTSPAVSTDSGVEWGVAL